MPFFAFVGRYLLENMGSLAVQLTPQEVQELEAAVPQSEVGDGYLMLACVSTQGLRAKSVLSRHG